jgi:hypothetical protein
MTRPLPFAVVAMVFLLGIPAAAQAPQATDPQAIDPPAHISVVDGQALLERDGQNESASSSMPVLAGDRVRTQGGRVEVLFADGSALHLDANTALDFQSDEVVRLLEGRVRLSIAGPGRDVSYRVDAPAAWVQIADPGEYRIAVLRDGEVELAVIRGAAELVNEQGRSYIRAGERTFARAGAAPSQPYVFNSAAWDAFDQWSEARRDQRLGASAQYLPNDVRPYTAAFDTYGSWRNEPEYGYVWYPRVHAGWRPYHYGRWVSLRPYGWTWIANDPWGWPTHHYGRWGISAGAWFWIPGRHWGPAWVSWAYAPSYVSWCPLGWNNRPVLNIVNVNFFGGRRYSPWYGWTVVPRRHFHGSHFNVARVASVHVDQRMHRSFVVRDHAPEARYAVSRSQSPIRSTGRYAVPRSGGAASAGGGGSRTGIVGGNGVERRFPAPARPPRTPSARSEGAPDRSGSGARAVSRERGAVAGSVSPTTREFRRNPGGGVTPRTGEPAPVTAPPSGAVRAVPRVRSSDASPAERRPVSPQTTPVPPERSTRDSTSSYSPAPASPRSPGAVDVYRSPRREPAFSGSRRSPDGGSDYRGRSVPRTAQPETTPPRSIERRAPEHRRSPEAEGRPAPRNDVPRMPRSEAPTFRSAPERRAPSGPPPSAAPPQQPSRGGGSDGGGSRSRPGGSSSSGQARRRG